MYSINVKGDGEALDHKDSMADLLDIADEITDRIKTFKRLQYRSTGQEYLACTAVIQELEKLDEFVQYKLTTKRSPEQSNI